MATDTSAFNKMVNNIHFRLKKSTKEIMVVVLDESKKEYLERKKPEGSSGVLFSSFMLTPIASSGTLTFIGIVFVGGPSAPYAPIVDQIGWKTKTGHKDAYNFMLVGASKGGEIASEIVTKNLSKI